MKFTRITILLSASLLTGAALAAYTSVSYTEPTAAGLRLKVVTANLNDPRICLSVLLAQNRAGVGEAFASMVGRARPDAAITGTFSDTRSLLPTGDTVLGGKLV